MEEAFGQVYSKLYREHWWFRCREQILLSTIDALPLPSQPRIMDVGCGDGLFLPRLAERGEVMGIEIDPRLISAQNPFRDRIHTEPLGHPSYSHTQLDLVTALDVIEHIEDDAAAVSHMASMLNPGGFMVVTVPALNLLWDQHDVINHHYRRYTAGSLHRLLAPIGRVVELRYFFRSLVVPKLAVKLVNMAGLRKLAQHNLPSPRVNRLMHAVCSFEDRLLRKLPIPFGTSLLAVVERPQGLSKGSSQDERRYSRAA